MATFKNKHHIKRNYECTNVVACEAETAPNDNYEACGESVLSGLMHLWTQNGVRYYGYP